MRQRKGFHQQEKKQLCLRRNVLQPKLVQPRRSISKASKWDKQSQTLLAGTQKRRCWCSKTGQIAWPNAGQQNRAPEGGTQTAHSKIPCGNTRHPYYQKQKILDPSIFAYASYTFHPSGVEIPKEKSICYQISSALLKSMEEHQRYLVPDSGT